MALQPRRPDFRTRDEVIAKLRELRPLLEAEGVSHVAIFGSIARGDDDTNSDIDLIVSIDASRKVDIFDFSAIKEFIASQFDRPLDLGTRDSLHPERHKKNSTSSSPRSNGMKIARYLADVVDYSEAAMEPVSSVSLERFILDRDLRDMVYYRASACRRSKIYYCSTHRSPIDTRKSSGVRCAISETSFGTNTVISKRPPSGTR